MTEPRRRRKSAGLNRGLGRRRRSSIGKERPSCCQSSTRLPSPTCSLDCSPYCCWSALRWPRSLRVRPDVDGTDHRVRVRFRTLRRRRFVGQPPSGLQYPGGQGVEFVLPLGRTITVCFLQDQSLIVDLLPY